MQCNSLTSKLTPMQRNSYSQTPEAGFYEEFQATFARFEQQSNGDVAAGSSERSGDSASAITLDDVLGEAQTGKADMWAIDDQDQCRYAEILDGAYANQAMSDPKQFLASLSTEDLDVVRRMHRLAMPICTETLSKEGASNLLLPEGYSVDLNRDGIDEVGAGKILHFPPRNAPAEFTDAWFEATKDLSGGEYMTHQMTFLLAFHPPQVDGATASPLPADQMASYQDIVANYLSMLNSYRGMLAPGQYERDEPFFSRLQSLLEQDKAA